MTKKKPDERWNQILQNERFTKLTSAKGKPEKPQKKVKARRKWGREAFSPPGEGSFSDDEQ